MLFKMLTSRLPPPPIIYCENSLRGDDWLYKQLVSRLRPIGCRLYNKYVYLDETGDLNATCRVEPSFTFRGWEIVERPSWESIQSGDFCYS